MRLVLADGAVVPDREGKRPGRGAYVCADAACLDEALRRKSFNRSFRGPVRLGNETLDLAGEWQRNASTR